jgi:MFS transporter, PAT family, beta-lactamase induction signal transducer AmpG
MASCNPRINPILLAGIALLTAFFSASQDVAIDAYRTDLLLPDERAPGTALNVAGYRIAMIVSGGLSLIIAAVLGWRATYIIMALLMGIGIIATWFSPEPVYQEQPPTSMKLALVEPFREFLSRKNAIALLAFIILYKISYACILNMNTTFLLRDCGFSLLDVGVVNKGMGLIATLVGVFIGGVYTVRLGLFRALFSFGLLQALGNLTFVWLAIVGKSYTLMILAIAVVNLFAGMEAAAFVTLLMSLCDHRYTATQYALLSACAMLANSLVAPIAGVLIQDVGWVNFYLWTVIMAFPGLVLLCFIKNNLFSVKKVTVETIEEAV